MKTFEHPNKPTKEERLQAMASYDALTSVMGQITSKNPEIEVEETGDRIKLPLSALELLTKILKTMSQGKPFSLVPVATEVTTQKAAEILGCSRPHIVKLLESGQIPFTKVGRHRRIKLEAVMAYKTAQKKIQKQRLIDMMHADEDLGLYDS